MRQRKNTRSWYFDVGMLIEYFLENASGGRKYTVTAPINLFYAMHEALRLATEKTAAQRELEHETAHRYLLKGLTKYGSTLIPKPECSTYTLNCVTVPSGVDEAVLRRRLLLEHSIEIGGGIGQLAGKVLRIGTMGPIGTDLASIDRLLEAMGKIIC
ncbi:MAG: hypothetical protein JNK33_01130 [Candidatus Doudnabacteria bacterium]|nr:hypothetical protein [Candidatus Doudnabacteria bacterium]